ncbi:uncharacterized protein N0V89_011933 [Didymosphaeria variabile]|uniref:Uncharacterized protein n=1 Tax=Didymosphaeria variabile TaxID=1932322 RepID=A0A9W9C6U7_9PLEO|nr:uncharacterized protein N0V89_011933 [Didymosphaeria variabile]KAJ4345798.1 hypothetical protein N0V89_011933 [Didymosphaeria variabile]
MSVSRRGTPLESETTETGYETMVGKDDGKITTQDLRGSGPTELDISVVKESNGLLDPTPRGRYVEIAQRNQETSPFLRLPPELRTIIYRLVCDDFEVRVMRDERLRQGARAAWRIDFDPFDPVHQSISFLRVCRAIYAEARLIPYAEAQFSLTYSNSQDPVVQHVHQRYALRHSTLRRSAGTFVFRGGPRERLPARILPVQTNAITTVQLVNSIRPTLRTLMEEVACLPALRQINWVARWAYFTFLADMKQITAIQESVGNSIQVVIKVTPTLEAGLRDGLDDQQWGVEKKISEQRAGTVHID